MRIIADGKNTVAALGFERNAELFKKEHRIHRRKVADSAVKELAVNRHIFQKLPYLTVVGYVAAPLAGYAKLFTQKLIRLNNKGFHPFLSKIARG